MIPLRLMLVLQGLRGMVAGRSSWKVPACCPRCQDECVIDLTEFIEIYGRRYCILRPGDALRCEKCDGRLRLQSRPGKSDIVATSSVIELSTHRRLDPDAGSATPAMPRRAQGRR